MASELAPHAKPEEHIAHPLSLLEDLYAARERSEVDSLRACYRGYTEAWIQDQYPHLLPATVDVQDFVDQLLDGWGGLPLATQVNVPPVRSLPEVELHFIQTSTDQAQSSLALFSQRIKKETKMGEFNADESWQLFLQGVADIIFIPPEKWAGSLDDLSTVLPAIPEPVTMQVVDTEWCQAVLDARRRG